MGQRTDARPQTDRREGAESYRVWHETRGRREREAKRHTCLVPNCEIIILSDTLAPGRNPGILPTPTRRVSERPTDNRELQESSTQGTPAPMHARCGRSVRGLSSSARNICCGGEGVELCMGWSTWGGTGRTGDALDLLGDLLDELLVGRLGHLQRHLHLSSSPAPSRRYWLSPTCTMPSHMTPAHAIAYAGAWRVPQRSAQSPLRFQLGLRHAPLVCGLPRLIIRFERGSTRPRRVRIRTGLPCPTPYAPVAKAPTPFRFRGEGWVGTLSVTRDLGPIVSVTSTSAARTISPCVVHHARCLIPRRRHGLSPWMLMRARSRATPRQTRTRRGVWLAAGTTRALPSPSRRRDNGIAHPIPQRARRGRDAHLPTVAAALRGARGERDGGAGRREGSLESHFLTSGSTNFLSPTRFQKIWATDVGADVCRASRQRASSCQSLS